MESVLRSWLQEWAAFVTAPRTARRQFLAAQQNQPGSGVPPGGYKPKPSNFAFPQKNVPLPYTTRTVPWEKRSGSKLFPNGARIAFIPSLVLEMWDFDHPRYVGVMAAAGGAARPYLAMGRTSLDAQTGMQFGGVIGGYRIAEHVKKLNIPFTVCVYGSFAEDFPDVVRRFAAMGCETVNNTYSMSIGTVELSKEEQRADILKTERILQQLTGKKSFGVRGQGHQIDENTLAVLLEEGYLYTNDLQNQELPFFVEMNGKTLVSIPYRMMQGFNDQLTTDTSARFSVDAAYDHLRAKFDATYQDAARYPQVINYEINAWSSGRAEPLYVFDKFIRHVQSHSDVWIATNKDVAEWWMKQYGAGYKI